jgi:hypothetical protein
MRRQTKRTRLYIGSWYIGSGNKISVFTRRSIQPFKKIKEVYGEELQRLRAVKSDKQLTFRTLSVTEREEIRTRVRKELKKEQMKKVFAGIITVIITVGMIITMNHFIEITLK